MPGMFPACRKSSYVITGNDDLLPLSGACPGIDIPRHRDDFQTKIAVQLSDQLRIVIGQHAVHPLRRQTSENLRQPDMVFIDKTFLRIVREGGRIERHIGGIKKDKIALLRRAQSVFKVVLVSYPKNSANTQKKLFKKYWTLL